MEVVVLGSSSWRTLAFRASGSTGSGASGKILPYYHPVVKLVVSPFTFIGVHDIGELGAFPVEVDLGGYRCRTCRIHGTGDGNGELGLQASRRGCTRGTCRRGPIHEGIGNTSGNGFSDSRRETPGNTDTEDTGDG